VGRKARPDATANPTKENILRRETISHSILLILSNLLDFDAALQRRTLRRGEPMAAAASSARSASDTRAPVKRR
jgi:hypothetical protein